jgi:AcrR family transcriptional regulator
VKTIHTDRKARGGRPRGFDREQALDVAMRLFWRHGYEGVSVGDITVRLGIAAPSLYAAFGSKAELYRAALERYEEISDFLDLDGMGEAATLELAVRRVLDAGVRAVTSRDRERGCMISDGLVACGEAHRDLAADLARRRRKLRAALARALERWVDGTSARSLARYVTALLQGLSIQARDGASAAELRTIVDAACGGLTAATSVQTARQGAITRR